MTCQFDWTLDWFYTMAKEPCGNCPNTTIDCTSIRQCVTADGVGRPVSLMNRVLPAPSIQICTGDTVIVNIVNRMSNNEGTSIHWHGLFMNGTQYMDGLPMVTQCPIPSPGQFQYNFTQYEPGTHWFHSHSGLQRGDGLMGSFIIRESTRSDPHGSLYDVDQAEDVIFLNDWYHETMVTLFQQETWAHAPGVSSILINGKGVFEGGSFPHPPVEVFNVSHGFRYRFRVISGAASFCNMQFSVVSHSLLMIASDGASFEPLAVDYFRISSGERYDFVLTANQSIDNYEIQVVGLNCTNDAGGPTKQVAFLHYDGAAEAPAFDVPLPDIVQLGNKNDSWKAFPDRSLAEINALTGRGFQYRNTTLNEESPDPYYLKVDFGNRTDPTTNKSRLYPQINDISFHFPTSPLLSQYNDTPASSFCNQESSDQGECNGEKLCKCIHTIELQLNQRIEIILFNPNIEGFSVLHPMHLHGMQYKILAMDRIENASIENIRQLYRQGKIIRNPNGPYKDVVIVPNGGYTIFQVNAWNPGWWIFHCHIEFHLEEGMALLFHVGEQRDLPPIPPAFPKCGVWPPNTPVLTETMEEEEAEPPLPDNSPSVGLFSLDLIHLVWIIPITLVIGLVIGVVIMKFLCVNGSRQAGSVSADPTSDTPL
ncbi:uncharacterized protein [Asterias amurensis]|uniref:uncharacterized protein n=1 Tax=Asterias amurensis TaxID=7602 RepID=UPI003AB72C04